MERMTKVDENIQTAQNMLSWIVERCYELEEENKKLKEENEIIMRNADGIAHHNVELMKKVKELEKKLWIE